MFVVLVPYKSQKVTIRDFVINTISPRRQTISHLKVCGSKYSMIECRQLTKQKHWEAIYDTAQNYKNAIVLPKDLEIPEDIPLKRYTPKKFINNVINNTAQVILKKSKIPLYKRTIGIIDLFGKYQNITHDLIKYAVTIKVLTNSHERYTLFAEQMLEIYGAVVILCENLQSLDDSIFILNFDNYFSDENVKLTCPIFSQEKFETKNICEVYTNFYVAIPDKIKEEIPVQILENIENIDILGALYEFNGIRELGSLVAKNVKIGNNFVNIAEICEDIQAKIAIRRDK